MEYEQLKRSEERFSFVFSLFGDWLCFIRRRDCKRLPKEYKNTCKHNTIHQCRATWAKDISNLIV